MMPLSGAVLSLPEIRSLTRSLLQIIFQHGPFAAREGDAGRQVGLQGPSVFRAGQTGQPTSGRCCRAGSDGTDLHCEAR